MSGRSVKNPGNIREMTLKTDVFLVAGRVFISMKYLSL